MRYNFIFASLNTVVFFFVAVVAVFAGGDGGNGADNNITSPNGETLAIVNNAQGNLVEVFWDDNALYGNYDWLGDGYGQLAVEIMTHEGGDGGGNGGPINPCWGSSYPDLVVEAIAFDDQVLSPGGMFDPEDRNRNTTDFNSTALYTPRALIFNRSCTATDSIVITEERTVYDGNGGERPTGETEDFVVGWYPHDAVEAAPGDDVAGPVVPTIPAGASTSTVFSIEPPYSTEPGTYPIRLQIDYYDDGIVDEVEYVNDVEKLSAFGSTQVNFSERTFPLGTHRLTVYVDVPGSEDPDNGCEINDWGCIREVPQDNNILSLLIDVTGPNIDLGSFILGPNEPDYSTERNYQGENREVGLVWQGDEINFGLCTGSGITTNGNTLNDFSGQTDGTAWGVGNYYDVNVVEPPDGVAHTYTITCDTTEGGTVSDTHIINNGADVSDVLTLATYVSNRSVRAGDTISRQPFSIENQSDQDLDDVTYTIRIDGQLVRNNASTLDLVADRSQNVVSDVTWRAPDVTAVERVDLEVCADHPNITRESCSLATITINPNAQGCWLSSPDANLRQCRNDCSAAGGVSTPSPGGAFFIYDECYCDGIPANLCIDPDGALADPIITATPAVVRQGGEFTLAWDPNNNPGCELSSNAPADADGETAGDAIVTANRQSTYTISCANGAEASVTIQLIPNLFET